MHVVDEVGAGVEESQGAFEENNPSSLEVVPVRRVRLHSFQRIAHFDVFERFSVDRNNDNLVLLILCRIDLVGVN